VTGITRGIAASLLAQQGQKRRTKDGEGVKVGVCVLDDGGSSTE
jgi:putative hemolysin